MFKVGKTYTITLRENGESEDLLGCTILEVNLPLIKIKKKDGDEQILNTGSLSFVRARRDD
jgi:hypothetical protein